jgi:uncharacterized protein YoxC
MPVSEIFSIILMGAAALLCIALVIYLYRITESIVKIQENVSGIATQFQPVINNITELTNKINDVTEELKQPVFEAVDVVDEIKERVDIIFDIEEKIRTVLGANIAGIYSGVRTFFDTYKKDGKYYKTGPSRRSENTSERIYTRL